MAKRIFRIIKIGVLVGLALAVVGTIALVAAYFYLKSDLPSIRTAADYNPPRVTRLYSDDGELVAEMAVERRTVIAIQAIPKHVVNAFLAAEDAAFYEHEGIDYMGILRAAIKNLRPGAHLQGASTITQQTVKTLVLGPERSYTRKLREAILTREMEQLLTKDEILYLYLNQIYFGSGAHGVEEAARTYFGKSVRDLDIGEAALLASIPKNPSHYTPAADPAAAKQRQKYVLEQMVLKGWATADEMKKALDRPIPAPPKPHKYLGAAPHYAEYVKTQLIEKYGEEAVMKGGLTIYTGMSARMQAAAHAAVKSGLEAFTRNQGYPGARLRIEVDKLATYKKALHAGFEDRLAKLAMYEGTGRRDSWLVWDLAGVDAAELADEVKVGDAVRATPLTYGQRLTLLVDEVDSVGDVVYVDMGSMRGRINFKSMQWARRISKEGIGPAPRDPSDVVHAGDIVAVDVVDVPPMTLAKTPKSMPVLELIPEPKVEAALVAIDPHTRFVRAVVGGYRAEAGGFNRAIQAKRQPGSSFKPFVYGAGILNGAITPATICPDTPITIRDKWTGEAWRPENYEDGKYDGNITYRTALMRSKNTCSVKLIDRVGFEKVIEFARAAGIESKLPENLTLALGTGEVTPLELANGYATVASGGYYAAPIFIRKVVDAQGRVLEESQSEPTQVIKPAVTYVLTQMMRSVVEEGTATKALVLDRPLAGKTGTSNQSRNVWFSGFSAELEATVWVGYDDNSPLGRATGGSTALPIWINFMGAALSGVPVREFAPPEEVVTVKVDPATGEPSDGETAIEEAFIAGTEPVAEKKTLPSIFEVEEGSGATAPQ